jgi:dihydroorotase
MKENERLVLTRPDQFHAHLRTGELMYWTLRFLAQYYRVIVAMPNIAGRPICTLEDLRWYRGEVKKTIDRLHKEGLLVAEPMIYYMVKLTPATTPVMISAFKQEGDVIAMKYYPADAPTTNAQGGIPNLFDPYLRPTLREMEIAELTFSGHFQRSVKKVPLLESEQAALPDLCELCNLFPDLPIVMEHISSAEGIALVKELPENVCGTLAIQHMILTSTDIIAPHNLCMPPALSADDRDEVVAAALSGNPKFFSGDDTAAHWREKKECRKPATGVFNAPVSFPCLVQLFDECQGLDKIEFFTAQAGARAYGLPLGKDTITMVQAPWEVPYAYAGGELVPFLSEQTMAWRLESSVNFA